MIVVYIIALQIGYGVDRRRARKYPLSDQDRWLLDRIYEYYRQHPDGIPKVKKVVPDLSAVHINEMMSEPVVVQVAADEYEHEEEMKLVNISTSKNPLRWFKCTHKDLPDPSPAEQLIIDELNKYRLKWEREVSLEGLRVNNYSWPRYDILIETKVSPTGYCIIEYHGEQWHQTREKKAMDKFKKKFCVTNSIPYIEYNKRHYYYMDVHIGKLMKEYGIRKIV